MALQPHDSAEVERSQTELKDKLLSGSAVPQVNVDAVRDLVTIGRFEFPARSGNFFKVKHVPYRDGLHLKDLYQRISLSQKDTNHGIGYEIYENQIREMLDIAWSLCEPEKRWMRFVKKFVKRRNPFHRLASEGDVAVLLSFFMVRRMESNVQFCYPNQ